MSAGMTAERAQLVQNLMTRQRWSREELLEHQRVALREILHHAVDRSPYYRETLGQAALGADVQLEELPTLPKPRLIDEWDRIVTDPRLRLQNVERHIASEEPTALHLGEYRPLVTGGSTGRRAVFIHSREEFEVTMAGMFRPIVMIGIRPETRIASIGSPDPLHLSNQTFAAFRSGRSGSPSLTVTTPLSGVLEALNAYRPEAITTYPTLLGILADEQLDGRLHIQPRTIACGSEVLTDEVRDRVREAWGVEIHDAYVSTEGGMMATECGEHRGLDVWEDCMVLEVVDEDDRAVPPGVPGHKVLLTNLWCKTQPLIRYELADSVTIAEGPNPTGRPFTRIERIDGRSGDILRLPALGGGEVAVHPVRLRAVFSRRREVRQYQLSFEDGGLGVRVVLAPDAPADTAERLRASLLNVLTDAEAVAPPIRVEPVATIARVGSGAKLTFIGSSAMTRESVSVGVAP